MRSENNLYEWTIILKKDGRVMVYRESDTSDVDGGGQLSDAEAARWKQFVFGEDYEGRIAELQNC